MEAIIGFVMGLFVSLGIFGWLLPIACLLLIFPLADNEKDGWAFIALALTFVFLYFLSGLNILVLIRDHWAQAVAYAAIYFAIGAMWSVFKWDRYCQWYAQKAKEELARFLKESKQELERHLKRWKEVVEASRGPQGRMASREWSHQYFKDEAETVAAVASLEAGQMPEPLMADWKAKEYSQKPSPFNRKNKITIWISYWPWSMIHYFFFKLLGDLIEAIWKQLVGIYVRITDRHYAGMDTKLFR